MKPIYSLLALSFIAFVFSCRDKEVGPAVNFVNHSMHRISVAFLRSYPDTALQNRIRTYCEGIMPNDSCSHAPMNRSWEQEMQRNPYGYISFIFIDSDTLKKYSEETFRSGYHILKRYDWNKDSLEKHHWRIVYP